jgi:hypothetical protein
VMDDEDGHRRHGAAACRWQGRGLVPGPHGVRSAGPGQPLDSLAIRGSPTMQSVLNLKVKYRESFRPFAPSVLREHVSDWFEIDGRQPLHAACCRCGQGASRRAMTGGEKRRCSASRS